MIVIQGTIDLFFVQRKNKQGIFRSCTIYRARRQDVAQEKERNQAAAKQSRVRQSNQLLLSLSPFPERHPVYGPGRSMPVKVESQRSLYVDLSSGMPRLDLLGIIQLVANSDKVFGNIGDIAFTHSRSRWRSNLCESVPNGASSFITHQTANRAHAVIPIGSHPRDPTFLCQFGPCRVDNFYRGKNPDCQPSLGE